MLVGGGLLGRFAWRSCAPPVLLTDLALRVDVAATWASDPRLNRDISIRKTTKQTARLFIMVLATPFVGKFVFEQPAVEKRRADVIKKFCRCTKRRAALPGRCKFSGIRLEAQPG